MAALIAAQRDEYEIPHAVACRAVGVSRSWFYKWINDQLPPRARVPAWIEDYNQHRHSALGMMSPVNYEQALPADFHSANPAPVGGQTYW